jgi:hypothetical protein
LVSGLLVDIYAPEGHHVGRYLIIYGIRAVGTKHLKFKLRTYGTLILKMYFFYQHFVPTAQFGEFPLLPP